MQFPTCPEFDAVHTCRGIRQSDPAHLPPAILSRLSQHPEAPFLTTFSEKGLAATLAYGELDELTKRLAHWLRSEWREDGETNLGLIPVNDAQSVVTLLSLMRAGFGTLLLSPTDPPGRLRQQASALGVRAVLRVSAVPEELLPESIAVPDAATLKDAPVRGSTALVESSAGVFFLGTSGSTATSKLVIQSHYNAASNATDVIRHHGLQPGDRFLGCLPVHHVNGLHFTVLATLAAGAHAVLAPRFDPFTYHRLLDQFRPRIASVAPSILEALLDTWRQPAMPREFRYFVSAAAPLSTRTVRSVLQKFGVRVLQGYGLTETTNFSTTMPADLSADAYLRLMIDADIPSVGIAMNGNEVAILSPDGDRLEEGEIGEICMRGHNVMAGYADNPEATAEAFRGGWFHSQDLGFEVAEPESGHRCFVITGRTKNIAKVRGEGVSLEEMERVLLAYPGVRDAACVALPHRLLGEEIAASVVADDVTNIGLRDYLRTVFAAAVVPSRIVRVDAIPRTATGKIRRAALIEQFSSPNGHERP